MVNEYHEPPSRPFGHFVFCLVGFKRVISRNIFQRALRAILLEGRGFRDRILHAVLGPSEAAFRVTPVVVLQELCGLSRVWDSNGQSVQHFSLGLGFRVSGLGFRV